ncbi:amino acid adenylation domain-containing protein, partial [Actinocorallia sp. B10E7]|uniref:amino acid adenylation domain-containing protein n=1 Tax=Actinocorallia sp. B10E7 TaxID=3153558 RepID=UPI00325F8597
MQDRLLFPQDFARQAARTPGRPAVACGDRGLDYAALEARANRLAHLLRERGAGPETVIGLCMERGIDQIVALLAVTKAGAAYLPLDPADPLERLRFMIEDAGAVLLLTDSDVTARLPLPEGCAVLRPDEEAEHLARLPATDPAVVIDPENTMYVIYTSGSTGVPKGVAVPYRAVANLASAQRSLYRQGPGERVLQVAPLRFDASVFDLCLALCTGGTLVLLPPGVVASGPELARVIEDYEVTTAAVLSAALQSMPRTPLPRLTTLISGGETIPARTAGHWAEGRTFVSAYGPTEATVVCTSCEVKGGVQADPPIGEPIPGTRLYLLDESLRPVHPGEPGEIFVGGAGVAHGYVNRGGLTAERFVPDPFSGEPGARLYRTGDLGRRREDSGIEFLGRADGQVKIRGFRVECGEIESRLLELPGVREAVVVAREDVPGDKRLVAYVTSEGVSGPRGADLRAGLRELLPEYMVPSAFVVLAEIPTTAHGKVDRRALPAPEAVRPEGPFVAASSRAERTIVRIWGEVLGLDGIGLDDDFFELGGHSLLAAQALTRLRAETGVELEISSILEGRTARELAARVEAAEPLGERTRLQARRVFEGDLVGRDDLPVSFGQQRMWFLGTLLPAHPLYNVSMAFRLRGPLDVDRLGAALDALVERHETLRTTFVNVDGTPRLRVRPAIPGTMAVLDVDGGAEAEALAREWLLRPFDLAEGPLVRFGLLRHADDHFTLLFVVHHIVADGWSMSLLCRELGVLYGGGGLADFGVRFVDFAGWQRE